MDASSSSSSPRPRCFGVRDRGGVRGFLSGSRSDRRAFSLLSSPAWFPARFVVEVVAALLLLPAVG